MEIDKQHIPSKGLYIGERVLGRHTVKLFLWKDTFFELWYSYGDSKVEKVEELHDEASIDIYIRSMYRTGVPEVSWHDKEEQLSEIGKKVKRILERDHHEFLTKLLWDQKLNWFCRIIEVKATSLIDKILKDGIQIGEAWEIAIDQLLENPQISMKPPYVLTDKYGTLSGPLQIAKTN